MVQTETHTQCFQNSIPVVTEERRVELELLRKHSTRHPEGVFVIYQYKWLKEVISYFTNVPSIPSPFSIRAKWL